MDPYLPHTFQCPNCCLSRVPDSNTVNKDGKRWTINQCRVCKYMDIEPAKSPRKVFKGGKFLDEEDLGTATD